MNAREQPGYASLIHNYEREIHAVLCSYAISFLTPVIIFFKTVLNL